MEYREGLDVAVPGVLVEYFSSVPRAALAFSGGVDSSYLLYAARKCGVDVRAYYVHSQFQPEFELRDAELLAAELHAEMVVLPLDVLLNEIVANNPADRCYHCKRVIFSTILKRASQDGYTVLMDGSNASDDAGDRPGMRALQELEVRSPLRDCGLTKADVRAHSKAAGLFTWDKPAYACLATRIPTGVPIEAAALKKVEKAEEYLKSLGFSDFRARLLGKAVKLQLKKDQLTEAAKRHQEIEKTLSQWFSDVLLDLKPR